MARQIILGPVPASGLAHLSEGESTTAPNETVPVVSLAALGEHVDVALVPKGNGALLAQVPDGTAAGGNKRGAHAVDLQTSREGASMVASGEESVLAGGSGNAVSGDLGACGGGGFNDVDAFGACIPGGLAAHTRGVAGKFAYASYGTFDDSTLGQAQRGVLVVRGETTDGTPTRLTVDGQVPGPTNINILPNNGVYRIVSEIVGLELATGAAWSRTSYGTVKRLEGALSTDFVGGGEVVPLYGQKDTGTDGWIASLVVDTVFGGATITVTGEAGKTIRWVATMHTTEVTA